MEHILDSIINPKPIVVEFELNNENKDYDQQKQQFEIICSVLDRLHFSYLLIGDDHYASNYELEDIENWTDEQIERASNMEDFSSTFVVEFEEDQIDNVDFLLENLKQFDIADLRVFGINDDE